MEIRASNDKHNNETGEAMVGYAGIVKAINDLREERDKLREALKPFALAFTESSPVHSIADDKVWLWKPSSNRRETHGISRAHLKTAACLVGNVANTATT